MIWDSLFQIATTLEVNHADDLEAKLASWGIRAVSICSIVVVCLLVYSSRQKRMKNAKKKTLFISICSLILSTTIFLFGTTIYLNSVSDSNGPVHWHADIEFWACGTEIELRDPSGALSNKIGSPTYHEHDDKRIHLEGVVVDLEYDASLEKFMKVTKGEITDTSLVIPTNPDYVETDKDGDVSIDDRTQLDQYVTELDSGTVLKFNNGDMCGNQPSEVQAYVFSYDGKSDTYSQTKLEHPKSYILRDESIVPPGDCVIVEFGPTRARTDKLCLQYGIRDREKCGRYAGVPDNKGKLCTMYEKSATGGSTL